MLLEDLSNSTEAKSNLHTYMLNLLDALKQVRLFNPKHSHDKAISVPKAICNTSSIGRSLCVMEHSLGSAKDRCGTECSADAPTLSYCLERINIEANLVFHPFEASC